MRMAPLLLLVFLDIFGRDTKSSSLPQPLEDSHSQIQDSEEYSESAELQEPGRSEGNTTRDQSMEEDNLSNPVFSLLEGNITNIRILDDRNKESGDRPSQEPNPEDQEFWRHESLTEASTQTVASSPVNNTGDQIVGDGRNLTPKEDFQREPQQQHHPRNMTEISHLSSFHGNRTVEQRSNDGSLLVNVTTTFGAISHENRITMDPEMRQNTAGGGFSEEDTTEMSNGSILFPGQEHTEEGRDSRAEDTTDTENDTPGQDGCIDNPCGERGQCRDEPKGGFLCVCQDGWTGTNCNVSSCGQLCQHGGVCQLNEHDVSACNCTAGWSGPTCSEDVNECQKSNLCNHGQCENTIGGYLCKCNLGYGGEDCLTWNGCTPETCKNGGQCETKWWNPRSSIRCRCPPAFAGTFCEKDNHCYSNPCGNRGDCTNQDEDFICSCFPGLTGKQCQERDFSVCDDSSCSKRGTCTELLGSRGYVVNCTCHHGFDGPRCGRDLLMEKDLRIQRLNATINYLQNSLEQKKIELGGCRSANSIAEASHKREVERLQEKKEGNNAAVRAFFDKLEDSTHLTQVQACRATLSGGFTEDESPSYTGFSSSGYEGEYEGSSPAGVFDGGNGFDDFDYFG